MGNHYNEQVKRGSTWRILLIDEVKFYLNIVKRSLIPFKVSYKQDPFG